MAADVAGFCGWRDAAQQVWEAMYAVRALVNTSRAAVELCGNGYQVTAAIAADVPPTQAKTAQPAPVWPGHAGIPVAFTGKYLHSEVARGTGSAGSARSVVP